MTVHGLICKSRTTSKDGNVGMALSIGQRHCGWGVGGLEPSSWKKTDKFRLYLVANHPQGCSSWPVLSISMATLMIW
jgi:hypothetical protein